jgi:hypothetical protein
MVAKKAEQAAKLEKSVLRVVGVSSRRVERAVTEAAVKVARLALQVANLRTLKRVGKRETRRKRRRRGQLRHRLRQLRGRAAQRRSQPACPLASAEAAAAPGCS